MMAAERGKTRFLQWREIKQSRHGPGCSRHKSDAMLFSGIFFCFLLLTESMNMKLGGKRGRVACELGDENEYDKKT